MSLWGPDICAVPIARCTCGAHADIEGLTFEFVCWRLGIYICMRSTIGALWVLFWYFPSDEKFYGAGFFTRTNMKTRASGGSSGSAAPDVLCKTRGFGASKSMLSFG